MPQVVGAAIRGCWPAVSRCQIIEELYSGAALGAQPGNAQARAGDIVQVLLFGAVVGALSGKSQAEQIAIEF